MSIRTAGESKGILSGCGSGYVYLAKPFRGIVEQESSFHFFPFYIIKE